MKITLCGSIAHYEQMKMLEEELVELGHEVKLPELRKEAVNFGGGKVANFGDFIRDNGGMDAFDVDHEIWDSKHDAILDHFVKIEWADGVLVANYEKNKIDGYVGANTLIEIGLAFYLKKKIYILNPISSELSQRQEIYAMHPTFLEGDVEQIGK